MSRCKYCSKPVLIGDFDYCSNDHALEAGVFDEIKCTYARMAGGLMLHCGNYVIDWDGDEEPMCEEHNEEANQMEAADLQRKARLEG